MNYFGLFFSFMIPGIILGMLAVGSIREAEQGRRRKAARRRQGGGRPAQPVGRPKQALYVVDLSRQEAPHSGPPEPTGPGGPCRAGKKRLEMPCPIPPVGSTVRFAGRGCLAPPAPAKGRQKPGTWGRSGKAVLVARARA